MALVFPYKGSFWRETTEAEKAEVDWEQTMNHKGNTEKHTCFPICCHIGAP